MTQSETVMDTDTQDHDKAGALAKAIDCELDEATTAIDDGDYLVLTDDEADAAAREYILDGIWAFRPSFLAAHSVADESVFEAIAANNKCEDNNAAILRLIGDIDHFVNDAISADGRGHFLSQYDGEEVELDGNLYAYRCN